MFLRRIRLRYRSYPRMIRTSIFFPPLCLKPFFFQTDLGVSSKRNPNPKPEPETRRPRHLSLPYPLSVLLLLQLAPSLSIALPLKTFLHISTCFRPTTPSPPRNFLTGNPLPSAPEQPRKHALYTVTVILTHSLLFSLLHKQDRATPSRPPHFSCIRTPSFPLPTFLLPLRRTLCLCKDRPRV